MDGRDLAVETTDLGRRYGRRWALAQVTLAVPAGARVMVTGRNGSGKSTLLRVLSTAIRADRGSARVAGHDVRRERAQVRRRVALLGHHSYHYEAFTALENLTAVARFLGSPPDRWRPCWSGWAWPRGPTIRSPSSRPACASGCRWPARCCRRRRW